MTKNFQKAGKNQGEESVQEINTNGSLRLISTVKFHLACVSHLF